MIPYRLSCTISWVSWQERGQVSQKQKHGGQEGVGGSGGKAIGMEAVWNEDGGMIGVSGGESGFREQDCGGTWYENGGGIGRVYVASGGQGFGEQNGSGGHGMIGVSGGVTGFRGGTVVACGMKMEVVSVVRKQGVEVRAVEDRMEVVVVT